MKPYVLYTIRKIKNNKVPNKFEEEFIWHLLFMEKMKIKNG